MSKLQYYQLLLSFEDIRVARNHWQNVKSYSCQEGNSSYILYIYSGRSTLQASSQNSIKMSQTVDVPTPKIAVILRYSADVAKAYKTIAMRFSKLIAFR